MSTQSQTQKQTEKPYIIVDFLDLEPSKFSFGNAKANTHGGHNIPLRYQGPDGLPKKLHVKYEARVSPFGISVGHEEKPEYKGKYKDGKKITGYSTSITCHKEYETDPYYLKACELDDFFVDACHKNAMAWHLGGSIQFPMEYRTIAGYDDKGDNGKWKRLLKWSSKKDASGVRTYLDYPPRLDFGITTSSFTERPGPDGLAIQEAIFKTAFFDVLGNNLGAVSSNDSDVAIPKFSRIAALAEWPMITQGTYGASLKPKAEQFRVFPSEQLATDECLLNDNDEDDFDTSTHFGGDEPVRVVAKQTAPVTTKVAAPAPAPSPAPAPVQAPKGTVTARTVPPPAQAQVPVKTQPDLVRTTKRVVAVPAPLDEEDTADGEADDGDAEGDVEYDTPAHGHGQVEIDDGTAEDYVEPVKVATRTIPVAVKTGAERPQRTITRKVNN